MLNMISLRVNVLTLEYRIAILIFIWLKTNFRSRSTVS